jgi:hypothetical protein
MELMNEALDILKRENPATAYAAFAGYAIAAVDLKTAQFINSIVKEKNN